MLDTDHGLRLDVERGPDWIFIRPHPPEQSWDEAAPLAEAVWAILEQSFTYRLVLELDEVPMLRSYLIAQLVLLSKRIHSHGGLLRLCGLSQPNQEVMHVCRLEGCLPNYCNRGQAVMGHRPVQPR